MAWTYEKYPDPVSPAYPLLIECGALDPRQELTAAKWCRLQPAPGRSGMLARLHAAVLRRLHPLEPAVLEDLVTGRPLILEARYLDREARSDLAFTCDRLMRFIAEAEAEIGLSPSPRDSRLPHSEPDGRRRFRL